MPAPTKIQWISYPVMADAATITSTHVRFPNPTESGDTLIVTGQFGSSSDVISAIADDNGGSLAGGQWVKDKVQANATNGQSVCILRRSNCPAGTRVVTISFSGATTFSQFEGLLVNNLATASPVDGTPSGGNPTGTTLSSGNITTSTTNTFVVVKMAETQGGVGVISVPTRFTAPANYTLWAPNGPDETACTYGTQAAAGTFNPSITSSRSLPATAICAVAYKTATSGGTPSSNAEVRQVNVVNFNTGKGSGTFGTTLTIDLPCPSAIDTVAFAYDDGSGIFQSTPAASTSSSPANTWAATTSTRAGSPGTGAWCGFVYAVNASVSATGTLTVTVTNAPSRTGFPFELYIWGIANGDVIDTTRSGAETLNTTPPVTDTTVLSSALATAAANELILFFNQEESQTVTSITSSTGTFLFLAPDNGAYESLDAVHDAGFGHVYATSVGSYNFDVHWEEYEGNSDVVGPWCAQAIAIRSQPPPSRPMFRGH